MRKSMWLASAALLSMPAFAQTAPTDPQAAEPSPTQQAAQPADTRPAGTQVEAQAGDQGGIVITATRRNEALSDVPLAVSAVTAESLANTGASDIRQLNQVSPSLLVSSTSSEAGAGTARIRGVGTVGDNPGLESSVAVFIDGVYRSRTGTGLTELGQVDRVEVLRGPQGTLFGRNASAGLISIITAKPKFKSELGGELTIGNYSLRRAELSATGPLSETIAARFDGVVMKRDGYLKDVISGRTVNDRDRFLVRGQMLFEPTDAVSFRVIADYSKRDEECCAAPYLPAYDTVGGPAGTTRQPSTIANLERALGAVINDDPFSRRVSITPGRDFKSDVKDWGLSGELNWKLGGASLTSITAYRYNNYIRGQDADFNNLDILFRASDGTSGNRFKTFSQELRLQGSALGDKLDWLVGGYAANEKLRVKDSLRYGADYLRYANCLFGSSALPQAVAPTSPTCLNPAVIGGAQAQAQAGATQLSGGIAQLTTAINGLSAIPARTPAQEAQLQALIAQRAGLQAQLNGLLPTLGLLNAVNANPANPGFGSVANALGIPGANPFNFAVQDTFNQSSNNFALFTHNIFTITEGLKFTLGLRYTRESKKLDATLTDGNVFCRTLSASPLASLQQLPCVSPAVPGGNFSGSSRRKENKLSGTAVLSYKPTQQLLTYASFSRGYKAGGFNLDRAALARTGGNGAVINSPTAFDVLQFAPEINNAFELGAKYNGRGIDVNIALFRQLYSDFQLNTFNGLNFEVANTNGCSADLGGTDRDNSATTGRCTGELKSGVKSRGVEFELFARPIRDVTFNLGMTYADTRYRNNLVSTAGAPLSPVLFQLPGRRLSNSTPFTASAALGFTPEIGSSGVRALFYVDARHMAGFNTGSDLDIEKQQDSFNVVNARIGLRGPDNRWAVELWAQNLFKAEYTQVAFDAPLQGSGTQRGVEAGFYPRSTGLYGAFLGEPRQLGLTLRGRI